MSILRWFNKDPVRILSLAVTLVALAVAINGYADSMVEESLTARIEALESRP